jgi:hypothetical protein
MSYDQAMAAAKTTEYLKQGTREMKKQGLGLGL